MLTCNIQEERRFPENVMTYLQRMCRGSCHGEASGEESFMNSDGGDGDDDGDGV